MTANRTRKTAQSKASKAPAPMDPEADEVGAPDPNNLAAHIPMAKRNCYSLAVLIDEVDQIAPEASHEITAVTKRGVGHGATFTGYEDHVPALARLLLSDERVKEVLVDEKEGIVMVELHSNPAKYDSRAPFGLIEAAQIVAES